MVFSSIHISPRSPGPTLRRSHRPPFPSLATTRICPGHLMFILMPASASPPPICAAQYVHIDDEDVINHSSNNGTRLGAILVRMLLSVNVSMSEVEEEALLTGTYGRELKHHLRLRINKELRPAFCILPPSSPRHPLRHSVHLLHPFYWQTYSLPTSC
jgi:hypothetical protein